MLLNPNNAPMLIMCIVLVGLFAIGGIWIFSVNEEIKDAEILCEEICHSKEELFMKITASGFFRTSKTCYCIEITSKEINTYVM